MNGMRVEILGRPIPQAAYPKCSTYPKGQVTARHVNPKPWGLVNPQAPDPSRPPRALSAGGIGSQRSTDSTAPSRAFGGRSLQPEVPLLLPCPLCNPSATLSALPVGCQVACPPPRGISIHSTAHWP